jgi:hypothetical protein
MEIMVNAVVSFLYLAKGEVSELLVTTMSEKLICYCFPVLT